MKLSEDARFSTICIHAGQVPDPSTGAIITPIYQTSTYVQEALGQHKGYEYARTQNPTRAALEANIAAIEGGRAAFAFASGMAAEGAVMTLHGAGGLDLADVVGTFCCYVHFFTSEQAAREWARRSDGTYVASIAEGFEYGRLYNEGRLGAALASRGR